MQAFQFRLQLVLQLKGNVSILTGIFINEGRGEVTHGALVLSLGSNEFIDMDGLIVQIHLSHIVHVMTKFWLDEIVGYHRVPHRTIETDVIVA